MLYLVFVWMSLGELMYYDRFCKSRVMVETAQGGTMQVQGGRRADLTGMGTQGFSSWLSRHITHI